MSFTVRRLKEERRRTFPLLSVLLRLLRPLLQTVLLRQQQRREEKRHHRLTTIAIATICAALLFTVSWNLLQALRTLSLSTILSAGSQTLAEDTYGHTNILLLGYGDTTHDGVDLIDSIIVASLDRTTESVALLSLPRDLYFLHTTTMGTGRLNSLYRDHKYALQRQGKSEHEASMETLRTLAKEISAALSMDIHEVIKVNFTGFVAAVDALGGVPIDIPADITDPAFPGPNDTTETFAIRKGRQTLDGLTALKYARSRSTTSDFDRSARQQLLLEALGKRVQDLGLLMKPHKLISLFNIVKDNIETTLSLGELLTMANIAKNTPSPNILAMHLSDRNGLYGEILEPGGFLYAPPRDQFDGASVLLPLSHPEFPVTWKQLQMLVTLFFHQRLLHRTNAQISFLNAGAVPGSARRMAEEFLRYGFPIGQVENAPLPPQEQSFILTDGGPPGTIIGTLLHLPLRHATESLSIVLGKDYRFLHLQDLPIDHS